MLFKGTVHLVAEWLSANLPVVLLIINLNGNKLSRFINEDNFCPRHHSYHRYYGYQRENTRHSSDELSFSHACMTLQVKPRLLGHSRINMATCRKMGRSRTSIYAVSLALFLQLFISGCLSAPASDTAAGWSLSLLKYRKRGRCWRCPPRVEG